MHVLLITSSYPRSAGDASGHFVRAEAVALVRSGHQVTVLAPGGPLLDVPGVRTISFGAERAFGWPGVMARLRRRPLGAIDLLGATLTARRLLAAIDGVDRVIAHWLLPCGWPIGTAARAPLEVVAHGSDVRLLLALPRVLRRRLMERLLARGTTFRFVSEELRQALIADGFEQLGHVSRVEPCALSLGDVPERTAARAALGIDLDLRLGVIVARLVPGKRVDVALAAAELIPGLKTVLIGDGPERRALERAFTRVEFLGQLPRPSALCWMRAADLVLSASRAEGAPTVIREARALGVPVVTTPCGDVATWAAVDPELHVTRR